MRDTLKQLLHALTNEIRNRRTASLRSPTGWLNMPSGTKVDFRHKGGKRSLAADQLTSAKKAQLRAECKKPQTKKPSPNVILEASRLAVEKGHAAALEHVQRFGDERDQSAAHLLRANQNIDSDEEWAKHVNYYLEQFDLEPISVLPGDAPRYFRITTPISKKVLDGPLVTILVPAFNAANFIDFSVGSLLNQTWQNIEVILIDDASTDETWLIMQSLAARDSRVKILRNKVNVGPYVAKNQALQIARGEFITGHDADDWAHPQNTRVHVQTMLSDRLIKASHCYHLRAEAQGTFTRFMKRGTRSHDGAMRLSSVSAMFHTETLRNVLGGWDSVRFGADSELICRAQKTLGDCYKSFVFVGLICLDHEGGLTNHPKYGIDKVNGMSLVRKIYKEKWSAWHESLMPADPYMPFPAKVRRFEAPQEMLVPIEAIEENIAPMRKHL